MNLKSLFLNFSILLISFPSLSSSFFDKHLCQDLLKKEFPPYSTVVASKKRGSSEFVDINSTAQLKNELSKGSEFIGNNSSAIVEELSHSYLIDLINLSFDITDLQSNGGVSLLYNCHDKQIYLSTHSNSRPKDGLTKDTLDNLSKVKKFSYDPNTRTMNIEIDGITLLSTVYKNNGDTIDTEFSSNIKIKAQLPSPDQGFYAIADKDYEKFITPYQKFEVSHTIPKDVPGTLNAMYSENSHKAGFVNEINGLFKEKESNYMADLPRSIITISGGEDGSPFNSITLSYDENSETFTHKSVTNPQSSFPNRDLLNSNKIVQLVNDQAPVVLIENLKAYTNDQYVSAWLNHSQRVGFHHFFLNQHYVDNLIPSICAEFYDENGWLKGNLDKCLQKLNEFEKKENFKEKIAIEMSKLINEQIRTGDDVVIPIKTIFKKGPQSSFCKRILKDLSQ